MATLSTHILDISRGKPAEGVTVRLDKLDNTCWVMVGEGCTDSNGRLAGFIPSSLLPGRYKLVAETGEWFARHQLSSLFTCMQIDFTLNEPVDDHYHLPFLIAPGGWSTYRGS